MKLKDNEINVCTLQETKKKAKDQIQYNSYLVLYSRTEKQLKANKGVAIVLSKKYQSNIHECNYVSSRFLFIIMGAEDQENGASL